MAAPVVVQGTHVANPNSYSDQPTPSAPTPSANFTGKGEKQESKCRDPLFALLLYINLGAIAGVAATYGPDAFTEDNSNSAEYDGYIYATIICAFVSFAFSAGAVLVMMAIPETLIKVSLIFVVVASGIWAVMSFIAGSIVMGVLGLIFFAIGVCYARAVWSRIPFASCNLVTALTAIKSNWGVVLYAYVFTLFAAGWSILWAFAFVGVYDQTYQCDENNFCDDPSYGLLFVLFVSYFFTHQVLQNSVHVTVAGTVGHWWFEPSEAAHCCSEAVNNSFIRTMTTSFGSICFGSLIVAVIQALKMLANTARAEGDAGIMACIAECILACLAAIVEYFNKWAFIYVGLYGYGYLDAGKNVFTLFRNRGWEAVITDDLIGNTLLLVSLVVGGVVGCIALIIEATSDLFEDAGGDAQILSFLLGFIVGMMICSIVMSTIGSAVNAVIVLFAEAPADFQRNYPELSNNMRQTWSEVFPGSV